MTRQANNISNTRTSRPGMLLLVVVLMLSLFMAAGAMLLTVAIRARASARAFAQKTLSTALNEKLLQESCDQSLLSILRGGTTAVGGTRGWVITGTIPLDGLWPNNLWQTGTVSESILHDKYGLPLTGTGNVQSGTNSSVITISASGAGIVPAELAGRLLTIKPQRPEDGDIATFRILSATGATNNATCFVANSPSALPRRFPPSNRPVDVIINGREFTPEAYDAYDDSNMWLAQPVISGSSDSIGQVERFTRMTFTGTVPTPGAGSVDNDLDGIVDGVWIPTTLSPSGSASGLFVLPDRPSPLGGTLKFQVSYLVLDLDGRINVNAAGIATRASGSYSGSSDAPLGMGYGPADIDASLLFTGTLPPASGLSPFVSSGAAPYWWPLLSGSLPFSSGSAALATGAQRTPPPQLGASHGRYGANGKPGGDDAALGSIDPYPTLSLGGTATRATYAMLCAGSNAVADLQGFNRVYMSPAAAVASGTQITPTLTYFNVTSASNTAAIETNDVRDNPYQSRLDGAPRADDQPFTLAELERILRPFDNDSNGLPQRLASGLSNHAQRSRMTITTDSWDTPALTGTAAQLISSTLAGLSSVIVNTPAKWRSSTDKSNPVSPDTAAGLRFNINRPIITALDRYEFCKDLYCLVRLLGEPDAKKAAQWAVNVLDFRDPDSLLTGFEYDTNISNGWDVDGNLATDEGGIRAVAWGVERPEMLITETLAYDKSIWVVLHRPWNAEVKSGSNAWPIETVDPLLRTGSNTTANTLSLKGWQLRLEPIGRTVSLAIPDASGTTASLAVNETVAVGTAVSGTLRPLAISVDPTGATSVFLERLADPSQAATTGTGANPYVSVDQLTVSVQKDVASAFRVVRGGAGSYWRTNSGTAAGSTPQLPSAAADWFHWPNRPFISNVELALVPSGSAAKTTDSGVDMLANFTIPTTSLMNAPGIGPLLLDATYVPSRFAGTLLPAEFPNAASNPLSNYGLDKLRFMTNWREPGKTNVNTIVSGTGTGGIALEDVVWTTLTGGTTANPFEATPAKRNSGLVAVSPDNPGVIRRETFATGPRSRNPFFEYYLSSRLANTATVRSQVFAIWVTVRVTDDSPNAPAPMTKRVFAIVDRSVPVGYSPGQDLNVSDCIRLKRYLD